MPKRYLAALFLREEGHESGKLPQTKCQVSAMYAKTSRTYQLTVRIDSRQKLRLEELQDILSTIKPHRYSALGRLAVHIVTPELMNRRAKLLKRVKAGLRRRAVRVEHLSPAARELLGLADSSLEYLPPKPQRLNADDALGLPVPLSLTLTPNIRHELDLVANLQQALGEPATLARIVIECLDNALDPFFAKSAAEAHDLVEAGALVSADFSYAAALALGIEIQFDDGSDCEEKAHQLVLTAAQVRRLHSIFRAREALLDVPNSKAYVHEAFELGLSMLEQSVKSDVKHALRKKSLRPQGLHDDIREVFDA